MPLPLHRHLKIPAAWASRVVVFRQQGCKAANRCAQFCPQQDAQSADHGHSRGQCDKCDTLDIGCTGRFGQIWRQVARAVPQLRPPKVYSPLRTRPSRQLLHLASLRRQHLIATRCPTSFLDRGSLNLQSVAKIQRLYGKIQWPLLQHRLSFQRRSAHCRISFINS
jgi:hypothetical protein